MKALLYLFITSGVIATINIVYLVFGGTPNVWIGLMDIFGLGIALLVKIAYFYWFVFKIKLIEIMVDSKAKTADECLNKIKRIGNNSKIVSITMLVLMAMILVSNSMITEDMYSKIYFLIMDSLRICLFLFLTYLTLDFAGTGFRFLRIFEQLFQYTSYKLNIRSVSIFIVAALNLFWLSSLIFTYIYGIVHSLTDTLCPSSYKPFYAFVYFYFPPFVVLAQGLLVINVIYFFGTL